MATSGAGSFADALSHADKLGASTTYTSSYASDDADFSQAVIERLPLGHPFEFFDIQPGSWRGKPEHFRQTTARPLRRPLCLLRYTSPSSPF